VAGAGVLLLTGTRAQELSGPAAVREQLEPLLKGRVLRLASQGDSAAQEFHVSVGGRGGMQMDGVRAGGQDYLALRDVKTGSALSVCGPGWSVVPSTERPGWLELLAGSEVTFTLDAAKRTLETAFGGVPVDSSYQGRMQVEMAGLLEKLFTGRGVLELKAVNTGGVWNLHGTGADGSALALELEPAAAWPFRALTVVRPGGSETAMTFVTGPETAQAWKQITVDKVYGLGLPVRVTHQAQVQWYKAENERIEPGDERIEKLTLALMQPLRGLMEAGAKGNMESLPVEVKAAAARLGTLVPPAPLVTLKAPPLPPVQDSAPAEEPDHPLPGDAPVTVPLLRLQSLVPLIEVEIDRRKHRFLVDTGATRSMITGGAATRAVGWTENLSSYKADLRATGQQVKLRKLAALHIGPWKLQSINLTESEFGPSVHPSCSGVIGCDILSQHPFTLDWQAQTLTFYPRAAFRPPAEAKETKLTLYADCPVVEGSLQGWGRLPVLLDTGASTNLVLKEPQDRAVLQGLRSWRRKANVPSGSVTVRGYAWPKDRPLELPFAKVEGLPFIEVSDGPLMQQVQAIGGTGWLRHFRLTFDLAAQRLWTEAATDRFAPPADPNAPDPFGSSPLLAAIMSGAAADVDQLLAEGAVVADGSDGHPAQWALGCGDAALALRLMELDKEKTWKKSRILLRAVESGNEELVDWLLSHGMERGASEGILALAAQFGDVPIARRLRAAGYPFTGGEHHAALFAVQNAKTDFLAWMLQEEPALANALLPLPGQGGQQAALLAFAATGGQAGCVKVLLAAGADPLLAETSRPHDTALSSAASAGHEETLRLLLAAIPREKLAALSGPASPLYHAVLHPRCVRALLESGVPPDAGGGEVSPLLRAATGGFKSENQAKRAALAESAVALIRAGADVNAGVAGTGGIQLALVDLFAAGGFTEPLRLVLAKGLPPDGHQGSVALAAQHGEIEALRILLTAGADPRRKNPNGASPLMVAVTNGHTPCVRELLTHKADAGEVLPGESGETLMHLAARFNDPYLLQLLADAGASVSTVDHSDRTPLHVAIDKRTLLAVRFFLSRGAKVNGPGLSPAEAADFLSPKYAALQEAVKAASEKEGK